LLVSKSNFGYGNGIGNVLSNVLYIEVVFNAIEGHVPIASPWELGTHEQLNRFFNQSVWYPVLNFVPIPIDKDLRKFPTGTNQSKTKLRGTSSQAIARGLRSPKRLRS
jgi:hypothetical protein